MTNIKYLCTGLLLVSLLSGCSIFSDPTGLGSAELFSGEDTGDYERIDLYDLFILPRNLDYYFQKCTDDEGVSKAKCYIEKKQKVKNGILEVDSNGDPVYVYDNKGNPEYSDVYYSLEQMWNNFNYELAQKTSVEQVAVRNHIQQRIIGASNQRCGDFQRRLHKLEADSSFELGSLSTLFAGAGAIFTPASTARSLSGVSGILSGVRAEYSQSYFRSKNIELITKGIDSKRRKQQICINRKSGLPLSEYTVSAAIADALLYHGSCTVVKGLEEATDTITRQENPGLDQIEKVLKQFHKVRNSVAEIRSLEDTVVSSDPEGQLQGAKALEEKKEEELKEAKQKEQALAAAPVVDSVKEQAKKEVQKLEKEEKIAEAQRQLWEKINVAKVAALDAQVAAASKLKEAAESPSDVTKQQAAKIAIENAAQAKRTYENMRLMIKDTVSDTRFEVCI